MSVPEIKIPEAYLPSDESWWNRPKIRQGKSDVARKELKFVKLEARGMELYQHRVIEEKRELDARLSKLEDFIFRSGGRWFEVPQDERLRMVKQYGYMSDYSRVLADRIAAFGVNQGGQDGN